MDLRDYIALTERTYSYRIKTIVPMDDPNMDIIERVIMKYDPHDISKPRKTMFQDNPLDFANCDQMAYEVYIVDVTLGLPVSPSVLRAQLFKALGVADKFVVVRGDNDPIENETQRIQANRSMDAEADKDGMTLGSVLLDPHYKEAETFDGELYGNVYNSKFLGYLKAAAEERKAEVPVVKTPLFSFIGASSDMTTDAENTLKTDKEANGDNAASAYRSIQGNYDGDKKTFHRVYKTRSGDEVVLARASDGVRKNT